MHTRSHVFAAVFSVALAAGAGAALAEPGPGPHGGHGPGCCAKGDGESAPSCPYHGKGGCPHHEGEHGDGHGCAHHRGGGDHGGGDPEMLVRMAEKIGASEATRKKIAAISFESREKAIALEAELEKARLDLGRMMYEGEADEAAVLKQVEAVGAAETAVKKNRVQAVFAIKKLLSEAQRKKLREMMFEEHHDSRDGEHGHGGPPGRAPMHQGR